MTNLHSTLIAILSLIFLNPLQAQFVEIIKDIAPGITGSEPENFAELDGKIFFFANDNSPAGLELWRSDGTDAGSEFLGDLNSSTDNVPGGGFSQPFSNLAKLGNELYFLSLENNTPGFTGDYTRNLFKVGSTGNPSLVKSTDIEFFGSTELVVFDGNLYWIQQGHEIWKSDGTAAGTDKFFETSDRTLEAINELKVIGNELFFTRSFRGINSFFDNKIDIWKTGGTTVGTQFVKRAVGDVPTDCGGYGVQMFEFNGSLAYTLDGNSMCSYESWMFLEGFDPFTYNHAPISGLEILDPTLKDGKVYFLTNQFGNTGFETNLNVLNGNQADVVKIFTDGARNLRLLDNGNFVLQAEGNLWTSDGTTAGTKEIRNFESNLVPKDFIKYDNGYLFFASEQTYTSDIYFTDGTVGGTRLLGSFGASNQVSPFRITKDPYLAGDLLYFNGNNGFKGEEPYVFDLSQVPPAPVCTDNLFTNPGFEDGFTGWTISSNATIDSDANSGNSAARLAAGSNRIFQFTAAEPNKEYTLRGKAKTTEFVNTYMKFLTADWQPTGRGMSQRIYGNYSPFEQKFTAPSDAAWIEVSFTPSSDADLLIDDLCLSVETGTPTAADLKITNVECPQQFPQTGEPITVQFTIENEGNTASDLSKVHLYRFLSTRFGSPSLLANVDVPALQPGESVQLSVTGNFPGGLPGIYYGSSSVPLTLGGLFLSFEVSQYPSNEADVDFYCKKTNTDLEIEIIPVTTEYDVSGDIVFKLKATNNGSEDAYNVTTNFLRNIQLFLNFHQLSAVVETDDTILQATGSGIRWDISRLNAGTSEEITVTYHMGHQTQFPNDLPDDFLIEAEISSGHNIDANPANNTDDFLFKRNVNNTGDEDNLTLTVVGDPSVLAWQNGTAYFEVTNRGGRAVNDIKIDFVLDQNVRLVGGNEYSASAGTTLDNFWTQNPTATIPSIGPGGLAHVQLNLFSLTSDEIKIYGQISEASGNDPTSTPGNGTPPVPNEDDEAVLIVNGGSTPLEPDLTATDLRINNSPIEAGEILNYTVDLSNVGSAAVSGDFSVKSYISTDDVLSNDDIQDGELTTGNFGIGFTASAVPAASTIPSGLADGTYFLILKIDADGEVVESNEGNNLVSTTFEVEKMSVVNPSCSVRISADSNEFNCVEKGIDNNSLKVVYDSSGYQIEKVYNSDLELLSTQIRSLNDSSKPKLELTGGILTKINADQSVVYQRTVPSIISDRLVFATEVIEFQNGFVFFGWEDIDGSDTISTGDNFSAIKTDNDFNILTQNTLHDGSDIRYRDVSVSNFIAVGNSNIVFLYRFHQAIYVVQTVLLDGNLSIVDSKSIASGLYAGGSLRDNACGGFYFSGSETPLCGVGFCAAGRGGNFRIVGDSIDIYQSYTTGYGQHNSEGSNRSSLELKTEDGGRLFSSKIINFGNPFISNNDDIRIFEKYDSAGNLEWTKTYLIPSALSLRNIVELNGEYFLIRNLAISKLDCYDTPVTNNGVDLELSFNAVPNNAPAQWSFFTQMLTIQNTGSETATGVEVEFKKEDEVVYKGGEEFTSSQGDFQYWGNEIWSVGNLTAGESATLDVNYFRVSGNGFTAYAQVSAANEPDSDSTPDNGSCCVLSEDDEAVLEIGAGSSNSINNRSSIAENLDSREAFAILNARPNPVFDQFNLDVFSNENTESELMIFDVLGRPVLQKTVFLEKGHNSVLIDASNLPSGILSLKMTPDHRYLRQLRLMKMNN